MSTYAHVIPKKIIQNSYQMCNIEYETTIYIFFNLVF